MKRPEPVSNVSMGVRWMQRVTAIGFEFALPPLLGGYLDKRLGTGSLLTIVGAIFGFTAGMIHLLAIAREAANESSPPRARPSASPSPPESSDGSNESGWADHG